MSEGFAARFGRAPDAVGRAPGRVNLLGEHTDYNDGFVLPIALAAQTTVEVGRARGAAPSFTLRSAALGKSVAFALDAPPEELFARYVFGCLRQVARRGIAVPALDIHVSSDVPMNVGLSSSAALEVATLRALQRLLDAPFDPVEIAQMAQRAEIEDAGVSCGIMDQMAASLADTSHALFLDTRTLATRRVPLPADAAVLVLDCGIARSLASSRFNERRRECEEAAARLGVPSLRDVDAVASVDAIGEPWRRRARHVVTENARVVAAAGAIGGRPEAIGAHAEAIGADAFGALMNASHASLRDDYEVSVPTLDRLVALLQADRDVHGARLTGAGFGGACIALCRAESVEHIARDVLAAFAAVGGRGRLLAVVGARHAAAAAAVPAA